MDINEAARLLHNAYHNAPNGRAVAGLHLFGIRYARELETLQRTSASSRDKLLKKLLSMADINKPSYATEIAKGINLAGYVNVKTDTLWFWSECGADR